MGFWTARSFSYNTWPFLHICSSQNNSHFKLINVSSKTCSFQHIFSILHTTQNHLLLQLYRRLHLELARSHDGHLIVLMDFKSPQLPLGYLQLGKPGASQVSELRFFLALPSVYRQTLLISLPSSPICLYCLIRSRLHASDVGIQSTTASHYSTSTVYPLFFSSTVSLRTNPCYSNSPQLKFLSPHGHYHFTAWKFSYQRAFTKNILHSF